MHCNILFYKRKVSFQAQVICEKFNAIWIDYGYIHLLVKRSIAVKMRVDSEQLLIWPSEV